MNLIRICCLLGAVMLLFRRCTDRWEASAPLMPDLLTVRLTAKDVTAYQGSDGSISMFVSGGMAPYRYLWSNGRTTKNLDGLKAGVYSVDVSDIRDSTAHAAIRVNQPMPDSIINDKEGNIYSIVQIGTQTWMRQNLKTKIAPDNSVIIAFAYGDLPENIQSYGYLYPWDVAMNGSTHEKAQGICPPGWHIPTDTEWKVLEIYLGMTPAEADIANDWRGNGTGSKLLVGGNSGFDALFGGMRISNGASLYLGQWAYFWTSSQSGQNAWRRCLSTAYTSVGRYDTFPKTYAFSIRCIKDEQK